MAGGIMSTDYLSVPVVCGHDAEVTLLSLTLTCGPMTVVELSGDLDMSTTHLITELVTHIAKSSPSQVILDMADVNFFCAAGLNALLHAQNTIKDAGGQFVLRNPSATTEQILTITRTADVFQIDRQSIPTPRSGI
jgi:anti-anti-sigma factor